MWIKLSFVCNGFWPRLSDCVWVKKNSSSFVVKHCLGRGLDPLRSCSNLPAATYLLRSCSNLRVFQYRKDSFKWSFWIILVVDEQGFNKYLPNLKQILRKSYIICLKKDFNSHSFISYTCMYFLGGWVGVEKNNPITYNLAKWHNQIVQIMKKSTK